MDLNREETGLLSPHSSSKADSTSHEDELRPTESAGDDNIVVEPSSSVHKKDAPSRY